MDGIVLDRRFRVWQYGVGHSQLLIHGRAGAAEPDHLNVLFEDVPNNAIFMASTPLAPAWQQAGASRPAVWLSQTARPTTLNGWYDTSVPGKEQ